jgi:hypothetical protein
MTVLLKCLAADGRALARNNDALLEGLNPAQRSAVTFGIGAKGGPVPPAVDGRTGGSVPFLFHRIR